MSVKWIAPQRRHIVSQTYNSGLCSVWNVTDAAAGTGMKPVPTKTLKVATGFDERRVGVTRFYQSLQAQNRIERVIRVPRSNVTIMANDLVTIVGVDGDYRVEQAQSVPDVWPESVDLSLSRVTRD